MSLALNNRAQDSKIEVIRTLGPTQKKVEDHVFVVRQSRN